MVDSVTKHTRNFKSSINKVLETRGLDRLTSYEQIPDKLLNEYQKEFWGEGQLFFYYKRLNMPSIPSALGNDVVMDALKYQMPLPQVETDFR